MSRKPENTFITGVHKYFPSKLVPHREKMANPYRGGTADCWYSGDKADLWLEYKFITRVPKSAGILPALSALQLDWLRGRYNESRNVAVIVGCPTGGVIYERLAWECEMSPLAFTTKIKTRSELAQWILGKIMK